MKSITRVKDSETFYRKKKMKWGETIKKEKQLNLPKLFLGVVVVGLAFVFSLSVLSDSDKRVSQSPK